MAYAVPNWAQLTLAKAAGLEMATPAIVIDNDACVTFMDLMTRDRFILSKKDGRVVVDKERSEKDRGHQRKRPAEGYEGFL